MEYISRIVINPGTVLEITFSRVSVFDYGLNTCSGLYSGKPTYRQAGSISGL